MPDCNISDLIEEFLRPGEQYYEWRRSPIIDPPAELTGIFNSIDREGEEARDRALLAGEQLALGLESIGEDLTLLRQWRTHVCRSSPDALTVWPELKARLQSLIPS